MDFQRIHQYDDKNEQKIRVNKHQHNRLTSRTHSAIETPLTYLHRDFSWTQWKQTSTDRYQTKTIHKNAKKTIRPNVANDHE